jgi:AraC-like DNA-binding protein
MLEETRPTGNGRARGLVSSRASGRRLESRTFAPCAALRDVVDCYWITRWDLRDQPPHLTELLADPCVTFAFEARRSRLVGVSTRLWRREVSEVGLIRAVKVRSGGARAFLGGSIADFSDRVVPLSTVFASATKALEHEVLAPDDHHDGLRRLEAWLLTQRRRPPDPSVSLAVRLVDHLSKQPQLTTVTELVERSGLSTRPLQRLFRDYVGASPKWVIRQRRLQEAAVRLEQGERLRLADLAAELGYADHAHLSRDFRAATGRTPSAFTRHLER